MENEIQKRRTYEILGKWIAKQNDITIQLVPDITPCADPVKKIIKLPDNVKAENVYPALAWLMHEAAHIRYTVFDAKNIVDDDADFMILNAVEDIRIDRLNFGKLPNIKGFYDEMLKHTAVAKTLNTKKGVPIEAKVLCDSIMMAEGFDQYTTGDPTVRQFIFDTALIDKIEKLISILNNLEHAIKNKKSGVGMYEGEAKKQVEVISEILSNAKKNPKQQPKPNKGAGSGGKNDPQSGKPQDGSGPVAGGASGKDALDLSDLSDALGGGTSAAIFGDLEKSPKNSNALGTAALQERTKQNFQELLNIKERQVVDDGVKLNTDSLHSFYLGDIEELFVDDITVKRKKSKIMMVLDCSGSMTEPLLDNTKRNVTLAETAKSIVGILEEAQALEGINVDWEVRAFDNGYHKLSKPTWAREYMVLNGGSTDILTAFTSAQEELLKDHTIEGKRMIVLITDGEVNEREILEIRKSIVRHNQDVRAMVLGVGAQANGSFVKNITGHNILVKDVADAVLMESIMEMLDV